MSCCHRRVSPKPPRLLQISEVPVSDGRSGEGLDDCYVLPFLDDGGRGANWRLTTAMQADDAEAFATECLARLSWNPSEPWSTLRRRVLTLSLNYDSPRGVWNVADVDLHYLIHLCAYYAAASCLARLLKLLGGDDNTTAAAREAFALTDKNGSSIVHAACWGCYYGVRDRAAYCDFLRSALRSGGSVAVRLATKIRDDFDFNGLELSVYLECYELAMCLLELPGVYVHSTVEGNILSKHYLLDEYLVGSHRCRFHRAPMVMVTSLATPEQLARLQESHFLEHPALSQMGMSFGAGLILGIQLLMWLACLAVFYWPLQFSYSFFRKSDLPDDPTAFLKCGPDSAPSMSVPLHAGVMLAKEDVEKRFRYALELGVTQLTELLSQFNKDFCPRIGALSHFSLLVRDKHQAIQLAGLVISACILMLVLLVPLRALFGALVTHYKLKWRSLQYRHLYARRAHRTDLLFFLCLFCWIIYWFFASFFNTSFGTCSLYFVQGFLCQVLKANGTDNLAQQIKNGQQVIESSLQAIGCSLHLFALCLNLLFLYMMESAPLFGETIMMFRQVLERFIQLTSIFIVCIVIFVNLFWAQTAGILMLIEADLGEFKSMDMSSFMGEFYRIFAISLNTFDPTTRLFGNTTLTMEGKKAEIKLLHFVYILCFVILTLNFLIAALVSFIDRTARHKSTMHFLHRVYRANRIRYGIWHPIVRLARLVACHRRKRTLVVTATVSAKNVWADPTVGLIPDIASDEAAVFQTASTYLPALGDISKHQDASGDTCCNIPDDIGSSSSSTAKETGFNEGENLVPSVAMPDAVMALREIPRMFNRRCKTALNFANRTKEETAGMDAGIYRRKSSF